METWKDEFCNDNPSHSPLELRPFSKDYKVVWEFNDKIGKWTVGFEETA